MIATQTEVIMIATQTEVKTLVAEVTFISSDINKVHVAEMLEAVVVRHGQPASRASLNKLQGTLKP